MFADALAALPSAPAERGRHFERLVRWFLENDPVYSTELRRVWLWDDWPGRWAADAGIDLVAEDRHGGLWAVQAKAVDARHHLRKSELDSFLSESNRAVFCHRLLVATTDLIGSTALRTLRDQEKPVGLVLRGDLEASHIAWQVEADAQQSSARPIAISSRPSSRAAVEACVEGLRKADRGQLLMACGTGKTLVGLWTSERLHASRTLVLLPSLALVGQTLRVWADNGSTQKSFVAVCSDPTVSGGDEVAAHAADLGVPVTTDPERLAERIREDGPLVVLCTYQSSNVITEAQSREGVPGFDLAIADEAHRCAGTVGSEFTRILDARLIRARKRLFMTATPRVFSERVRRGAADDGLTVASMDDDELFGPVLHELSFARAVELRLLADYQVVIIGVDQREALDQIESRRRFSTELGSREAIDVAALVGTARAISRFDVKRAVSFHGRVKHARTFARDLPIGSHHWCGLDSINTLHVHGEMPVGQRRAVLREAFRAGDGHVVVTNARCLSEGIDIPAIDGVIFVTPKSSQIDIVQAVGRAMRTAEGKSHGTIVLPVMIDPEREPEAQIESSQWRSVWRVLRALRAHDQRLAEDLDELRRSLGRGYAARLPSRIHLDLPVSLPLGFVEAVTAQVIRSTSQGWDEMFETLGIFASREGHSVVPSQHLEGGKKLGRWVNLQRVMRNAGQLSAERQHRLEKLPSWTWAIFENQWQIGFAHLERFVQAYGTARVPQQATLDGFKIGRWVLRQRQSRKVGRLSVHQIALLENLPGWIWDSNEDEHEAKLTALRAFAKREGHCRLPKGHIENGVELWKWVESMRRRHTEGRLNTARIQSLEGIAGWTWPRPRGASAIEAERSEAQFLATAERLSAFVAAHGRFPRFKERDDGVQIGVWVTQQRRMKRLGRLPAERAQLLEQIEGWTWDARADRWDVGFAHLLEHVASTGSGCVSVDAEVNGFDLGRWAKLQRENYGKNRLSPERAQRLDQIDGWYWHTRATRTARHRP